MHYQTSNIRHFSRHVDKPTPGQFLFYVNNNVRYMVENKFICILFEKKAAMPNYTNFYLHQLTN